MGKKTRLHYTSWRVSKHGETRLNLIQLESVGFSKLIFLLGAPQFILFNLRYLEILLPSWVHFNVRSFVKRWDYPTSSGILWGRNLEFPLEGAVERIGSGTSLAPVWG